VEDELSQLDQLIESDVLDALGEENPNIDALPTKIDELDALGGEIVIEDAVEEALELMGCSDEKVEFTENKISTPDINSDSLATLLSQLLNNKTIEITIKIKD
jgi:hypothetical protein